jgi:hypothetical protein
MMRGGELLPGTHGVASETIIVRNWQEFRGAIVRLRRRFPYITRNRIYREQDQKAFKIAQPVVYELVFRGQTEDYSDGQSGKPLLLPQAFRPGVQPAWLNRGPPGLWGESPASAFDESLAHAPPDPLSKSDDAQIRAYHRGLLNYCLHLLGVANADEYKAVVAKGWVPGSNLEDDLRRIALYSTVLQEHRCILTDYPYPIPPLKPLLADLSRYHDCQSVLAGTFPRLSDLLRLRDRRPRFSRDVSNDAVAYHLRILYVYSFLRLNVLFMPVALAILQHYGLPTRGLDVTFDPRVALWFAIHVARRKKRRLWFEDSPEPGYVYALWVPVTFDWGADGGRHYRWARGKGYGLEKLLSPLEPALLVDLSSSLTLIDRDAHTRSVRQQAALLTAHVLRPDWPSNAYAEYLVAKLEVSPEMLDDPEYKTGLGRHRTSYLFPPPSEDRLLFEMRKAGVRRLEVPVE